MKHACGSWGAGELWEWEVEVEVEVEVLQFFRCQVDSGGANVHCGPHTEPLGLLVFVPGSLVGVKDIGFVGRPEAETP
jgi:hypothetical protein